MFKLWVKASPPFTSIETHIGFEVIVACVSSPWLLWTSLSFSLLFYFWFTSPVLMSEDWDGDFMQQLFLPLHFFSAPLPVVVLKLPLKSVILPSLSAREVLS